MALFAVMMTFLTWKAMHFNTLRRTARTWQRLCTAQADTLAQEAADSILDSAVQSVLNQHTSVRSHKSVLPVRRIAQLPELPQGCEATAAATVLQFLSIPADKTELADSYLVKVPPDVYADPYAAYMGDPRGDGWYCYAPPICNAVNRYLTAHGLQNSYQAVDITGTSFETLRRHLYEGRPVVIWATLRFGTPYHSTRFQLSDGAKPYSNLHCLVLTGYDETNYYFADPLCEVYTAERETVEKIYTAMGKHAMLICETAGAGK